ncbi:MAG TPA: PAS domain S-box protein, partial [Desulfomonilaceae bacterium]|nr:PAS domain S-box protein [Desulfomonilaceae bacterium]
MISLLSKIKFSPTVSISAKITAIYFAVGTLWILFSDAALGLVVRDPSVITKLSMAKGFCYVSLTALMLYVLVRRGITERKRADESIALLSFALNHVRDAAFLIDEKARFHFVNEESCRVLGYTRPELLDMGVPDIDPDFPGERWQSHWNEIKALGSKRLETRHRTKDGRIFPVEIYANFIQYGDKTYNLALVRDITERKKAEEERASHLRFLECMDRINRAMQGTNDLEQMMSDVLDVMLSIFECDRVHLLYPCDPDAPLFEAVMERTQPEYPGERGVIPMSPDAAKNFQLTRSSSGAVAFGPEGDFGARFGQKSQIMIALYPKIGKPWALGMHQCSYPRPWRHEEKHLLEEIARGVTNVLTSLLAHRDLQESEERHRVTLQTAMDGFFRTDTEGRILQVNEAYCRMSGYSEQELLTMNAADISAVRTAQMIADEIRSIAEKGPRRFESVHRRRDGSLFDVEMSTQYQPKAGGQIVVFVRDITVRKRAEEALRQSEAYLAEAQRLSQTGSFAFDVAGNKYIYLSEECARIFELDAQEDLPIRETVSRLIHPEDWDRVRGDFEKLLHEKVDTPSDFRIALPSGTVKHIHVIRHPVLNDAGEVVTVVGTAMDITERKQAEEVLRLAGVYNRTLIEASLDPLVTIDPEGRISDVNAATELVTGYTREQLIGTDFFNYFTEPEKARAGYEQAFNQGFVRDYELEIRNRNGEITPVVYNASVYRDEIGNLIGVFAAARDITELQHAQETLSRLAAIVESSNDAIIGKDLDGTITSWNKGAEQIYGYSAGETLGRPVSILHLPGRQDEFAMFMGQVREGIRIEHYETKRIRKDGQMIDVSLTLSPIRDRRGVIIGASTIARDISTQKRAEEALRRSEASLAEAQRLSHTGSWIWDVASNMYTYSSEENSRIYGVDRQEDLETEGVLRIVHPDDRDRVKNSRERSLREKVDTSDEFRIVLADGTMKHIHAIRHPVLNDAEEVVQLEGTTIDITERKRQEEEQRQNAERFRAVADYTFDWESWIGVDGKLLWINPAVERITGYSVDECMAMPDFPIPIIAEADRETVAHQFREAVQGSSRNDFEFRVRRKDGLLAWVAASWQPISDSRGAGLGYRSSIRDIAERKQAEGALRESEAALALERDRLSLLLEINNHIVSKLEPKELFHSVAQSMRSHFGADV